MKSLLKFAFLAFAFTYGLPFTVAYLLIKYSQDESLTRNNRGNMNKTRESYFAHMYDGIDLPNFN